MEEIMVSIICNTYNHVAYISSCIDGFLKQKTNFNFEILINDDCSTDGTSEIVAKYVAQYPTIIKAIIQKENQWSKGISITPNFQYPRVRGKYIAFCEGDDYWTDPLKLQKQFDVLEKNNKLNMVVHNCICDDQRTNKQTYIAPKKKNGILSFKEVLYGGGAYVATCSIFFRSELIKNEPPFRKMLYLDYSLQLMGAIPNGIYYINDCMGVYRFYSQNSWTRKNSNNPDFGKKHRNRVIKMLEQLDEDTNGEFHFIIKNKIIKLKIRSFLRNIVSKLKGKKHENQ